MKIGKINFLYIIIFLIILTTFSNLKAEEKILSAPIINLEKLEPSYENIDLTSQDNLNSETIKLKKKNKIYSKSKIVKVNILGLDKITAKTTKISILIGEKINFGLLEIKVLKCGSVISKTEPGHAAYLQVKDLSDNQNEKVFVFNGWTFSSSPTLKSIDHPVYDLWLTSCENV